MLQRELKPTTYYNYYIIVLKFFVDRACFKGETVSTNFTWKVE